MSRHQHRIEFGIVTADLDDWSVGELRAAGPTTPDLREHAVDQLRQAMHAAGQAFIAAHPTVWAGDLI